MNAKLRGWGNYYRPIVASATFHWVDWQISQTLTRWIHRRHNKSRSWKWRKKHYYRLAGNSWLFCTSYRRSDGTKCIMDLFKLSSIKRRLHPKVRARAHAYDPAYDAYFAARKQRHRYRVRVDRLFVSRFAA